MNQPVVMTPTEIPDVLVVETRVFGDSRGFFTESYSERNWEEAGLSCNFVQDNLSLSCQGTLRGLHYQIDPHAMGKLVRAYTGSLFDVAMDLRVGSPTFGKWVGRTLSAENMLSMWIPAGFAHGFLALEDDTMFAYKCTGYYAPEAERTIRYNDPEIGIDWPFEPSELSAKDLEAPALADAEFNFTYAG